MTEFRLFDSPGADVATIVTDGATIKPFLNAINRVYNEVKLTIDKEGLTAKLVDPANVYMGAFELGASAFDTYNVESETVLGVPVPQLKDLVRRARMHHDDKLTLSVKERELTATVARGYDAHDVVSQGTMQLIDSDSIREEPDIPDVDPQIHLSIDTPALTDALSYAVKASDTMTVSAKAVNQHANALYIGGEADTTEEAVAIDNIESDRLGESYYNNDYIKSILKGIGDVGPEMVNIRFDDDFPIMFKLERDEIPFSVEYMLAPRIRT